LIEHGLEAFVEFIDRFLDLRTLDQAPNLQEESHPCLAAGECLAAVSLHDVERNPSSRRIRHALNE